MERKIPICPVCGSKNIVARLATKTFWCRRCMHVGPREEFFKIQDEGIKPNEQKDKQD